jgi:hypothetical protein
MQIKRLKKRRYPVPLKAAWKTAIYAAPNLLDNHVND